MSDPVQQCDDSGGAGADATDAFDDWCFSDDVFRQLDLRPPVQPPALRGGRRLASAESLESLPAEWLSILESLGIQLRESQAAGLAACATGESFILVAATGSGKGLVMQLPAISGWIHGGSAAADNQPIHLVIVPYKALAVQFAERTFRLADTLWRSGHTACEGVPMPEVLLVRRRALPSGADLDGVDADEGDTSVGSGDSGGGDSGVVTETTVVGDATPVGHPYISEVSEEQSKCPLQPSDWLVSSLPCGKCSLCRGDSTLSTRATRMLNPRCLWSCRSANLSRPCQVCQRRAAKDEPIHWVAGCKEREALIHPTCATDSPPQTGPSATKTRSALDQASEEDLAGSHPRHRTTLRRPSALVSSAGGASSTHCVTPDHRCRSLAPLPNSRTCH